MPNPDFKPWTLEEIAEWERAMRTGDTYQSPVARKAQQRRVERSGHGSVQAYVDSCRCRACVEAASPYLSALGLGGE